jgi:hypothetical protein
VQLDKKIEEGLANAADRSEGSEDEVVVSEELQQELQSPGSPASRKRRTLTTEPEITKAQFDEQRKRLEDINRHLNAQIEKLSSRNHKIMDDLKKELDNHKFEIKECQNLVDTNKAHADKKLKQLDDKIKQEAVGKDGSVSKAQKDFNRKMESTVDDVIEQVNRLQRLDHRLNKELVNKPYAYIDKVKDNLDQEQKAIREIISKNNQKYLQKIGNLDVKANEIMSTATELHDSFKRKLESITRNLESTKKLRFDVENSIDQLQKQIVNCEQNCDENHIKMKNHIDNMALRFAEHTVDLTSAGEGYQREIERMQIIFRELSGEFLTTVEEKKKANETLLRGAGLNQQDIRRFKELANISSKKSLSSRLPNLQLDMYSTLQNDARQERVLALLKQDQLTLDLNKNNTQRRFFRSPSTKSSPNTKNSRTGMVNTVQGMQSNFMPGGSFTFLTGDPNSGPSVPSGPSEQHSLRANILSKRKGSHAPHLPQLNFLSKQELQNTSATINSDEKRFNAKSVRQMDQPIGRGKSPLPAASTLHNFNSTRLNPPSHADMYQESPRVAPEIKISGQ